MQTRRERKFARPNDSPQFISAPAWPQCPVTSVGVLFLKNELDVGLTFAWVALFSRKFGWNQKVDRNTLAARRAYDSLCRFRDRVFLTGSQSAAYDHRFASLRERLIKLGEVV